jgi:hypothetical protein
MITKWLVDPLSHPIAVAGWEIAKRVKSPSNLEKNNMRDMRKVKRGREWRKDDRQRIKRHTFSETYFASVLT